jgi:tRNA (guanine-N7-)-methyltransferase
MTRAKPTGRDDLRSFGRRRVRSLSPQQKVLWLEALPRHAVPNGDAPLGNPANLFAPLVREVRLEIGFGGGEHLLWQAKHHPDVGFIGCEPFQNGVVKVLAAIERGKIANIRIHPGDARELLRRLPSSSIPTTYVLFPDPWPKKRHHKRRLISETTVAELARVMPLGGELRIATDVGDYARTILLLLQTEGSFHWGAQQPADWRQRPADWPSTRYEAKALKSGRRCYYFRFQRR